MRNILFISLCFLSCLDSGFFLSTSKCKRLEKKADKCFKTAFFIGETVDVPKDATELKGYCNRVKGSINCGKSYKQCTTGLANTIFGVAIKGMVKAYRSNCRNASKVSEILKVTPCIGNTTDELYACFRKTVVHFRYISENVTGQNRLPSLCCAYATIKDCFYSRFTEKCSTNGKEAADFVQSILDDVLSEAVSWACKRWNTIGDCKKAIPEEMKAIERIALHSKLNISDTFIIEPLLKLAETFAN